MMRRVKDAETNIVHFTCPSTLGMTLCAHPAGVKMDDLFNPSFKGWPETEEVVTCKDCAKVYCSVKNEPWNTQAPFEDETLEAGIFAAVGKDGPVCEKKEEVADDGCS